MIPDNHHPGHVLIIEDDQTSIQVLEHLLNTEGYSISIATDGKQGFNLAVQTLPDLVLSDVMMPEIDGFELCRKMRAHPMLATVPIILLTGLDDHASRIKGLEAGADDFFTKPLRLLELRARIRTILKLNRYRRLVAERAKFEWVVDHSDDAYLLIDESGLVTYANNRAHVYLSLEEDCSQQVFPQDTCQAYRCEPKSTWQNWPESISDDNKRYLLRPETETSPAFWLQVDTYRLPMQTQLLVRLKNVSEQVSLLQHVYTFQMLVSHKLRTPLTSLSALSVVKQQVAGHVSDDLLDLLDAMDQSGQRLQQQILDILDYISAPSLLMQPGGYALSGLSPLLKEIEDDLTCPVSLVLPENLLPLSLHISEPALRCVLDNIMGNAKKFHPSHSPQIEIELHQLPDEQIRISVRDDGQHLSPGELGRVWQPYYQSEKNLTGEIGGMGVGLSTVSSLILGAGGHVAMHNRTDKPGIVVLLTLPVVATPELPDFNYDNGYD